MTIGITSNAYFDRYGLKEGAERMRRHGYDCVDYQWLVNTETPLFSLSQAEFEKRLIGERAILEGTGIRVSQTHGPWRCPIRDATKEDRDERFEKMAKSLYATALLGSSFMVIHPIMPTGGCDKDKELTKEVNADFFGRLTQVAQSCGVVICLENMPFRGQIYAKPEDTLALVKQIHSPYFRMCLDTGHAAVWKVSPADAVRQIGREWLCTLHVHDNDGEHDQHRLPGEGVIDWADFSAALREIGFEGTVSLETRVQDPVTEEAEMALAETAKKLAQ